MANCIRYDDDSTVQSGKAFILSRSEAAERGREWIQSDKDFLRIEELDDESKITSYLVVSRKLPERISYVRVSATRQELYCTERHNNSDVVVTDGGKVPRKYFLTDLNARMVMDHFFEYKTCHPSFNWVDPNEVGQYWW